MSQRALARALAGQDATDRQVENERRQIARYLADENVPTLAKSRRIAAVLGGADDDYTASADERRTRADDLRAIAATLDELSRLVEDREEDEASAGDVGRIERRLERLAAAIAEVAYGQAQIADALGVQLDEHGQHEGAASRHADRASRKEQAQ